MKKPILGCLGALVLFIIILVLTVVGGYNRLTRLSQGVDSQWAQVQNVYQRRIDLIPNLVQTVQGAANFEKSTLEEVTQARAAAENSGIDPNSAPCACRFLWWTGKLGGFGSSGLWPRFWCKSTVR